MVGLLLEVILACLLEEGLCAVICAGNLVAGYARGGSGNYVWL